MRDLANDKFSVLLEDGCQVEAVWYASGTLCLSTQVGCAVGCPFCASGSTGFIRNLSLDELHLQVEVCRQRGRIPERLTLSGIGEPLHNLSVVSEFLLDARRDLLPVSLTTTGSPLQHLESLLRLPHNGVMLSLHAGTARTHRRLVPRGPDWDELWEILDGLLPRFSRRRRRKLGINYLVFAGINDGQEELAALAERLKGFPDLTLHLLNWNPVATGLWPSPEDEALARLRDRLAADGLNVRLANRWRRQLQGGCGTLLATGRGCEKDP